MNQYINQYLDKNIIVGLCFAIGAIVTSFGSTQLNHRIELVKLWHSWNGQMFIGSFGTILDMFLYFTLIIAISGFYFNINSPIKFEYSDNVHILIAACMALILSILQFRNFTSYTDKYKPFSLNMNFKIYMAILLIFTLGLFYFEYDIFKVGIIFALISLVVHLIYAKLTNIYNYEEHNYKAIDNIIICLLSLWWEGIFVAGIGLLLAKYGFNTTLSLKDKFEFNSKSIAMIIIFIIYFYHASYQGYISRMNNQKTWIGKYSQLF